jgi:hypothetical protein
MPFSLSPIGNEQQVSSNGAPLSGGLLYTYVAGSTTPAPTYTDSTGATPQANPIVLNTLGRPASPIWLADGSFYKFVLTTSTGVAQWTIDEVTGVSSSTPVQDEWVLQSTVPTYLNATQFSVPGDQTSIFTVGRRIRAVCTGGVRYGYISVSAYTSLTTVTLVLDAGTLDSGISAVSVGLLSSTDSSMPWIKSSSTGLTAQGALTVVGVTTLAGDAVSALQAVPKQQLDAAIAPATLAPTLFVPATAVELSSGASATLSAAVPSWARELMVVLDSVSSDSTGNLSITFGDSDGIETTGYSGLVIEQGSTTTTLSTGFVLTAVSVAAAAWSGIARFVRVTSGGNDYWVGESTIGRNDAGTRPNEMIGRKQLSSSLTTVNLSVSSGSFDGGRVQLFWR